MTQPKQMFSWMNPKLELRKLRGGAGIFAREQIAAKERLAIFGGYVTLIGEEPQLSESHGDFAIQVEERFVLGAKGGHEVADTDYFNHSCDPNAGIRGQIFLDAMRDIVRDEEITFDYAMVLHSGEGIPPYELECHCGSPNCRGRVTDSDWLIPELQQRYDGWFSWFLQEKVDREQLNLTEESNGGVQVDKADVEIEKCRGGAKRPCCTT